MSLAEVLQVTAAVIGAVATVIAAAEQAVVKRFRRDGATTGDRAIDLPRLRLFTRWRLARLIASRAVVVDEHARAYLDETVYAPLRKRQAIIGLSLVALIFVLIVIGYAVFHGPDV